MLSQANPEMLPPPLQNERKSALRNTVAVWSPTAATKKDTEAKHVKPSFEFYRCRCTLVFFSLRGEGWGMEILTPYHAQPARQWIPPQAIRFADKKFSWKSSSTRQTWGQMDAIEQQTFANCNHAVPPPSSPPSNFPPTPASETAQHQSPPPPPPPPPTPTPNHHPLIKIARSHSKAVVILEARKNGMKAAVFVPINCWLWRASPDFVEANPQSKPIQHDAMADLS